MLRDEFTSVLQARNREELRHEVVDFTKQLGFEKVTATVVVDRYGSEPQFTWVDNTPLAYKAESENFDNARRDPVSQHCRHLSSPIIWDRATYLAAGLGEKWEMQAEYGYCTGIALALHLPKGLHFLIGVDRDQLLPKSRSEVSRMAAELYLFATHAQDAALRLLMNAGQPDGDVPNLTSRELESLRWTMEGKTAWEVGCILGISEQTAARHLNNATHKLDCVNKHHAMVKALRLGLIR